MVRSNPVSFGRFAQCEALETRSHLSANAFEVTADVGGTFSNAADIALLKDGRVVVVSEVESGGEMGGNAVAVSVFNKNGTLSKSFDGDGIAKFNFDDGQGPGYQFGVEQASDGGILVTGERGIFKVKLTGKADTAYGKAGFVTLPFQGQTDFWDYSQLSNGTTRASLYDDDNGLLRLAEVDTKGKITKSVRRTVSKPLLGGLVETDASGVMFLQGNKVYRFDVGLAKVSSFGSGGVVDLTTSFNKWAEGHGPFSDPNIDNGKVIKHPPFNAAYLFEGKNGIGVAGSTGYTSPNAKQTQPHGLGEAYTELAFLLTNNGKSVAVDSGPIPGKFLPAARFTADFSASIDGTNFAGVVTKTSGTVVNVSAFSKADFATSSVGVRDNDGSFFIAGTVVNYGDDDETHYSVGLVHTQVI